MIDRLTAHPASTATLKPFNVHSMPRAISIMVNVHVLQALEVRIARHLYVALWPGVETGAQEMDRSVSVRRVGRELTATYARRMTHVTH